ncbi:MAG TPA: hypothetical protein VKU00_00010, partial [Chthonomonadaceae bacterium]|nr:hypothetical protein [Chthonomonadaceae bacterium]
NASDKPTARQQQLNANLLAAVEEGEVEQVAALLRQGADPNTRDNTNVPVFYLTSMNGDSKIFHLLDMAGQSWYPPYDRWWVLALTGHDPRLPLIEGKRLLQRLAHAKPNDSEKWAERWKGKTVVLRMYWGVMNPDHKLFAHYPMSLENAHEFADVEFEPAYTDSPSLGTMANPVWLDGTIQSIDVPHKIIHMHVKWKDEADMAR